MFINEKWFQQQTPEHKKIIVEAARIATIASRGMSQNFTGHALSKCLAKGIQFYNPTPQELEEFAKIGQPAYLEVVKKEAGQEWIDKTLKAAAEAKKALGDDLARIIK
jgi:TRAP-type C4-dicarboxylate transport system substrate-binding protein